jgi:hypothetical protein
MPEVVYYVAASLNATSGLDPVRSRVYKERAGFSKPR